MKTSYLRHLLKTFRKGHVEICSQWYCELSLLLQSTWLCAHSIRPAKEEPPSSCSRSLLSREFTQTLPVLEMPHCLRQDINSCVYVAVD